MATTVSVIIPAYNSATWVGETIASLASQDRRPDQLILVDDGSADDTAEVAKRALALTGLPGILLRQENRGIAAARNAGALASQGDLVAFVDADDLLLPSHFRLAVAALEQHPEAVACFSDVQEFDEAGDRPGTIRSKTLARRQGITITPAATPDAILLGRGLTAAMLLGNFITNSTVVIRRTALSRSGLFDAAFPIGEDRDLYMRLSLLGPFVELLPVTARQRRHPASAMATRNNLQWAETSLRLLAAFRARYPVAMSEKDLRESFDHSLRTWVDVALHEASAGGWTGLHRMITHIRHLGHRCRPQPRHVVRALLAGFRRRPRAGPGLDMSAVVPRATRD